MLANIAGGQLVCPTCPLVDTNLLGTFLRCRDQPPKGTQGEDTSEMPTISQLKRFLIEALKVDAGWSRVSIRGYPHLIDRLSTECG
jgi:hypothetical protein